MKLAAAFIAKLPAHGAAYGQLEDLEASLQALVGRARAAWPSLKLPADQFLAHLAARLPPSKHPQRTLEEVAAEDLYLACCCATSDPTALAALETTQLPAVARAVASLDTTGVLADEVKQVLLEELAVVLKPSRANPRAVVVAMAFAVVLAAAAGVAWQQLIRPPPVAAVARKTVSLGVGQQKLLSLLGIQKIVMVDPSVVSATAVKEQQVLLAGVSAGVTTVVMERRLAPDDPIERVEWEVQVEDTGAQDLRLTVGEMQTLTIPGLTRIAVGDPKVLDVRQVGNEQLEMNPRTAGSTTLLAWRGINGQRMEWRVVVSSAAEPAPEPEQTAVERKSIDLLAGAQLLLSTPHVQRLAVGDASIADVKTFGDHQVLVVGRGKGVTTLIAWTEGNKRLEWDVHVVAK